jgi:Phage Mu protein F like protein
MSTAAAFGFTGTNPAAQAVAKRQAASMVVEISSETEAALRALIARAIREGIPPYDAARLIESMIGLDERRAGAVLGYRESLINEGLSFERVNTLTDRYSQKLLRQRAETIARTEIMDALNEGARESYADAQDDGLLSKDAVKEWIVTPDEALCPSCEPMDGVQVPLNAPFQTPEGPVDGPPLHPNCRCAQAVTEPDR